MDILVMENLFYDTSVKKVFDLKGSMRNRYAEKTGKDVEVFLDENLVESKHYIIPLSLTIIKYT